MDNVVVVGGGAAGLICSVLLVRNNIRVEVFDRMDSPGRKLILAGMSGLNFTNILDPDMFASRYRLNEAFFSELLKKHSPENFISFFNDLGIETFTGSSGKVFPVSMKADEVLEKIISYLETSSLFSFYGNHRLVEIDSESNLVFETDAGNRKVNSETVVFALGGGSRSNTGSDGKWTDFFDKKGIHTVPLEPSNCGFEVQWTETFKKSLESCVPLKNISLHLGKELSRNEVLLTGYGIEGSGIYCLGGMIREKIKSEGECTVFIDIIPDLSAEKIREKLKKPRGKNSLSNYLRKSLSVNPVKFRLIRELLSMEQFTHLVDNPGILKNMPLTISGIRPLEEAISSSGGVDMAEINENMMLKKIPGFYVIGEMADWDAPTGGYLLQGCFSTASAAVENIIDYFKNI